MNDHLSKQYDNDLEALRSQVLQMGGLVEAQVRGAIQAFSTGNLSLADQIVETEVRVNTFEVDIDTDCSQIIVKRQPAATDLRLITVGMKISQNLERVGDEAVTIARRARDLSTEPQLKPYVDLPRMATMSLEMLRDAITAHREASRPLSAAGACGRCFRGRSACV